MSSEASDGSVRITVRDVFNAVNEVKDLVSPLVEKTETHREQISELRSDVRDLQRRVWALPSVATALAVVALIAPYLGAR